MLVLGQNQAPIFFFLIKKKKEQQVGQQKETVMRISGD